MSTGTPFDESSQDYLESSVFTEEEDLDRIADWMNGRRSVLDVGAGTLHTAGYLRQRGIPRTVGLDPSRPMLKEGRGRYEFVRSVAGRSEVLPFREAGFDGVVSRYAAHHFPSPAQSLREMRRVLDAEGTLVFQDLIVERDDELGSIVNQIAALRDPSHEQYRSPKKWKDLLREAGLIVRSEHFFQLPLTYETWLDRSDPAPDARRKIQRLFAELTNAQRKRISLNSSEDRPKTFEYPVQMLKCELG